MNNNNIDKRIATIMKKMYNNNIDKRIATIMKKMYNNNIDKRIASCARCGKNEQLISFSIMPKHCV